MNTTVNISSVIDPASTNLLGVNLAYWDDKLTTAQTQSMVQAAGLDIYRFPGGSASDDYHFNSSSNDGDSSANTIPQFAQLIDNVGGLGIVTIDYGSGSPQEAEAELAYLTGSPTDTTTIGMGMEWSDTAGAWQNVYWQTVGYWAGLRAATPIAHDDGYNFLRVGHASPFTGINYWEVGNEQYGTWETDHYSPTGVGGSATSGSYNYPAAYAQFAASFSAFVTADKSLPSILIGIDSGDPSGDSDNNWTKNVLIDGLADGFVPRIHFRSQLHVWARLRKRFDPAQRHRFKSRQLARLVHPLYRLRKHPSADRRHQRFKRPHHGHRVQLQLRHPGQADDQPGQRPLRCRLHRQPARQRIHRWIVLGPPQWLGHQRKQLADFIRLAQGGDEGILGDPNLNEPPITGPYVPYPNYFGFQLASKMVQSGGTDVSAVSNYNELAVYSVLEANATLTFR